jgi:hypothetical protein
MKNPFPGTAGVGQERTAPLITMLATILPRAQLCCQANSAAISYRQEKILQFPPEISCRQEFHFWNSRSGGLHRRFVVGCSRHNGRLEDCSPQDVFSAEIPVRQRWAQKNARRKVAFPPFPPRGGNPAASTGFPFYRSLTAKTRQLGRNQNNSRLEPHVHLELDLAVVKIRQAVRSV